MGYFLTTLKYFIKLPDNTPGWKYFITNFSVDKEGYSRAMSDAIFVLQGNADKDMVFNITKRVWKKKSFGFEIVLSMEKTMAAKVNSGLKLISELKIFLEIGASFLTNQSTCDL